VVTAQLLLRSSSVISQRALLNMAVGGLGVEVGGRGMEVSTES
jgi:hypothetical protein